MQQHLPVVAVVGGDILDLRVLGLEPVEPVHRRQQRAQAVRLDHQALGQQQERRETSPPSRWETSAALASSSQPSSASGASFVSAAALARARCAGPSRSTSWSRVR
ncbi:hypothetical protein [Streptomyces sp. NPDC018352]|uniref:hypothetical protein n=1 Tax=Streptomyces sp. NPDC018352 TaxID=3157194 RepID=UPI00340C68B3